jgi:hypothetical protein
MEQPPDIVDDHINDFIQTGRCRWDLGCFNFDRDPIYDIEGTSWIKDKERISSEDFFLHQDGPYMCQLDDMVIDLFHPFEDDPTQHFRDDFRPSLVSCDADLFCEDFRPSYSDFDRHQVLANPKQSKVHVIAQYVLAQSPRQVNARLA